MPDGVPGTDGMYAPGLNYWFTQATGQTAFMLCRALFLEHQRQREQG